jgi:hypothetical protein
VLMIRTNSQENPNFNNQRIFWVLIFFFFFILKFCFDFDFSQENPLKFQGMQSVPIIQRESDQ